MYEQIKSDIVQEYYKTNFPNDGQRFIAWYLRNIHNLDIVEAKSCITDGAGDKQIDAIYIDDANEIAYIIQGKFYSGETVDAEPLREVLSSWAQIRDLAKLQESANEKLKIKINELSKAIDDSYEICFELITTSALTDSAKNDLEVFRKLLSDNDDISANIIVVDNDTLQFRYSEALNKSRPYINHSFALEDGKYMVLEVNGAKAAILALPLKECIKIPGIKDQSLFRKNVRQSLGNSNKVNKGIAKTLKTNSGDFFFLHNGVTAICSKLTIDGNTLIVKELNVVNGCQSLTTIYSCSEAVKNSDNAYITFRFYEISDAEKVLTLYTIQAKMYEEISADTNREVSDEDANMRGYSMIYIDLTGHYDDKAYEQYYTDGYFITKRGEIVDSVKYNTNHVVNLTDLGKQLVAWHSQRPTISYSETKIFDKYFDQIFHKDYAPQKIQALNELYKEVISKWTVDNPMGLNETLLAMKSYAPYHHLYAISVFFCAIATLPDLVPDPAKALEHLKEANLLDTMIDMAGTCLNIAFENASADTVESGKIFSPQNWVKNKGCLKNIKDAVRTHLSTFKYTSEGKKIIDNMTKALKLDPTDFENRWSAD